MGDERHDHDIDLSRAILIAAEQIASAILESARADQAIADAIAALVPPRATHLSLEYKLKEK